MKRGRKKREELDGGGTVSTSLEPETTFVSDPHQGDLDQNHQIGVSGTGSQISTRSVYFAICYRDWYDSQTGCPLYKVDVALSNSDDSEDHDSREPPAAPDPVVKLRRIATLGTDIVGMTFISMESSGWIVGIGGDHPGGGTIIFDTKGNKVIHGPKLIGSKWRPVVAAVGNKIYALSHRPDFVKEPDFVPWFEVLDLSKATVTEKDEAPVLDGCSWEALPYPLCFPCKLTPSDYQGPPFIRVMASVVVEPYILISLNGPSKCVYVFDTNTGKWHNIHDVQYLPFVGAATQLGGHGSSIFLASTSENGPINAYDIHVSSDAADDKDGALLKLSINVFSIRKKYGEYVCAKKADIITSLGKKHFCELIPSDEGCGRYLVYDKETEESYPGKLNLQLCTYQTEEIPALQGKTASEIAVSCQQELTYRIRSSRGFSSTPIVFALSI